MQAYHGRACHSRCQWKQVVWYLFVFIIWEWGMADEREHRNTKSCTHVHIGSHAQTLFMWKWTLAYISVEEDRAGLFSVSTWFEVFGLLPVCYQRVRKCTQWECMTLLATHFLLPFKSLFLTHTHIYAQDYRLSDVLWYCFCRTAWNNTSKWWHKIVHLLPSMYLCVRAFVCWSLSVGVDQASRFLPGKAAAEHTAWQQQQQMVSKVIFHLFQGLLSESLSYIMFFSHLLCLSWDQTSSSTAGNLFFTHFSYVFISLSISGFVFISHLLSLIELSN